MNTRNLTGLFWLALLAAVAIFIMLGSVALLLGRRIATLEGGFGIVAQTEASGRSAAAVTLYQHPLLREGMITTPSVPVSDFPGLSVALATMASNRQPALVLVKGTADPGEKVKLRSYVMVFPDSTERKVFTVALPH